MFTNCSLLGQRVAQTNQKITRAGNGVDWRKTCVVDDGPFEQMDQLWAGRDSFKL